MRILVTGASGFLGSHIVDQCLSRNDVKVCVLVRQESDLSYLRTLKGVEFFWGDLADRPSLTEALKGVHTVIHSAARVVEHGSREEFFRTNVLGTQNLLNEARRARAKRFVFISSPSVVMDMTDQLEIDESYPYPDRYVNLYSETKALAERHVLSENNSHFMTCALRPRAIWGPRDSSGFLPRVLAKMASRKIQDISGGKKVWASLCYCSNAAEASLRAAFSDHVGGKAYFITDRETIDVWEFAKTLSREFNLPPIQRTMPSARAHLLARALAHTAESFWNITRMSHVSTPPISRYTVGLLTLSSTYSTKAAERDFNYSPLVSQDEGLQRLRSWIDQRGGIQKFLQSVRV